MKTKQDKPKRQRIEDLLETILTEVSQIKKDITKIKTDIHDINQTLDELCNAVYDEKY